MDAVRLLDHGLNMLDQIDHIRCAGATNTTGVDNEIGVQLAHFRANRANQGRVLDSGLWRYTRHPNYFGDFCVWWAIYLLAASGGATWTIGSPLLMSILLMYVSGVRLTEQAIHERRPAYAEYQRRTNAFFPGPPRTP